MPSVIQESVDSLWRDISEMHQDHMVEVLGRVTEVNIETYRKLEAMNMLKCYSLREDGELLGYAVYTLTESMHGGELSASNVALYLRPCARVGWAAYRFIKRLGELLCDFEVYYSVSHKKDFSAILKRMGYEKVETVYRG